MAEEIVVKRNEYHSVTSTFTYNFPKEDVLKEFGTLEQFEKAVYQHYNDKDYDKDLAYKFSEFESNYDYIDRVDDMWTECKGGYEVDYEIEE